MNNKRRAEIKRLAEQGFTQVQIAHELGIGADLVSYYVRRMNLQVIKMTHPRKYTFDEDFFSDIDTEAKAYFLGLMLADGYLARNRVSVIQLQEKDKGLLEIFMQCLGYTGKLRRCCNNIGSVKYELAMYSRRMYQVLCGLGMSNHKSFTAYIPEEKIPCELFRHALRGYFDGDGHVGMRQCVLITASRRIYEQFMKAGVLAGCSLWSRKYETYYRININRRDSKFVYWMYADSEYALPRKKEKVLQYFMPEKEGTEAGITTPVITNIDSLVSCESMRSS